MCPRGRPQGQGHPRGQGRPRGLHLCLSAGLLISIGFKQNSRKWLPITT